MKLRTMAMVLIGAGAIAGAGCKKKPKEGKAPDTGSQTATGSNDPGSGAAKPVEPTKEAKLEGKPLAEKYIGCAEMLNGQKWDDFKSKCVSADFKAHEMDAADIANPDAMIEMFKGQSAAFPDMKFAPQLAIVNGRNLYAVGMWTGTHKGTMKMPGMPEIPATNKPTGSLMFHKLAINDENKATEEWAFFDPSTMMYQLGLMPKEAGKMRDALTAGWPGAPIIIVAADNDVEKKNLETIQKANAAFMSKKAADYMAFYADDAFESDQASEKDMKGKKEIQAGAEMFLKAFPDLTLEWPTVVAAGDYVVALGTFKGTNNGPLGPMKPTKKAVSGNVAELYKLKDGKITEVWRFRNGMAMAIQLGLAPDPSKAGAPPAAGSGDAPKGDAPKGDAPKKDAPKDEKAPAKKSG